MTQSTDNPLNNISLQSQQVEKAVETRLREWKDQDVAGRLWSKDPAVWAQAPETQEIRDRLGWLYLPESMRDQVDEIKALAEEIKKEHYLHVVVLGMGGSSLAPEVFQETFGNAQGYPELRVLDSTHPGAIESLSRRIDPQKTLFLVSSKSGTTLETSTLYYYFWNQVRERTTDPGRNFVAITDPRTPLARMAEERRFRRTFLAPADVGGRYSALSVFGMVPAALIGIDIGRLLEKAWQMAESCGSKVDPSHNPGVALGAVLGELGMSGRDKITFVPGAELASLPLWLEQLIAESTGKNDKGLIPVAGEMLGAPDVYGADRVFVGLSLRKPVQNVELKRLQAAGHPVLNIEVHELPDLGQEFFRWEMAVAAAGAALQIHPFDQPDVQLAKDLARKAMESTGSGKSPAEFLNFDRKQELSAAVKQWLGTVRPGDYFAIQAYLEPGPQISGILEQLRNSLRDRFRVATTVGYGPRFLHSTGQLHKGGPNTGLFLQLVDRPVRDLTVPEKGYTFGTLIRAQAEGDFAALKSRERRALRIDLGENAADALAELQSVLLADL